jgi:PleD family two-component response regulator
VIAMLKARCDEPARVSKPIQFSGHTGNRIAVELSPFLRQPSIMVVDDYPANLQLLEDMLLRSGYQVRLFQRGSLALVDAAEQ